MYTITSELKVTISEQFMKEEAYNKRYLAQHPDKDISVPWTSDQYHDFVYSEGSPYPSNDDWNIASPSGEFLTDSLLDHYLTDVYAMIPPNYFPIYMHWHTFFELAYVLEGTCTNYSGNQRLELKKGDLLILAPGTSHGIGAFTDSCRIINVMMRTATFEETFFNKFYEDDVLFSFFKNVLYHYKKNTYILFHTGEDALLRTLLLSLLEEIQPHHSYQEQIRISSLSLIFSRIMDKYAATAMVFGDNAEDAVYDITLILTYMQNHYTSVTLEELSGFFGYSERHMTRILKSYTGFSYQENLNHIKMRAAVNLLKDRTKSIDQIAQLLGFSTPYSFRKSFKNFFGITPGKYREE